MTWWCIYFAGNQLSNLHSIIISLYGVIHQLSTNAASNTSIIVVRKTHYAVALCIYIVVLAS